MPMAAPAVFEGIEKRYEQMDRYISAASDEAQGLAEPRRAVGFQDA